VSVPRRVTRLLARLHARRAPFVFILAPMRSGTTLLQHILAEEPEFLTAGETHVVYRSPRDLRRLLERVYAYHGWLGLWPRRVVEKCVTDDLIEDCSLPAWPRVQSVFLVREPLDTVRSLLALRDRQWPFTESVETAGAYYLARLAQLERLAEAVPERARGFVLTYADLVDRPERALGALSHFLGLARPLRPEYREQRWTGESRRGDLSETIRQGTIVRREPAAGLELPPGLRERLVEGHAIALERLRRRCLGVEEGG
jgi:hypothetical protein